MKRIPLNQVEWNPGWRIISTRYPQVNLYERIAADEDLEALKIVESLTNPRVLDLIQKVSFFPAEERIYGRTGADLIMASFCYCQDGRFSRSEELKALYLAKELKTAIEESKYHIVRRFLDARIKDEVEEDVRVLTLQLKGKLHDIRNKQEKLPEVYSLQSYASSQLFALDLKRKKSKGILYSSLRSSGGECAAVFSPTSLERCETSKFLRFIYKNGRINSVLEVKELR